ncbi:hypothetical protein ACFLZP_04545 [Patescibacteria group bacterium]
MIRAAGLSKLKFIKSLGSYQRFKIGAGGQGEDKEAQKTIHLFLFKTKQLNLKPVDSRNRRARWVKKEAVADLLTHPKDKKYFEGIIGRL